MIKFLEILINLSCCSIFPCLMSLKQMNSSSVDSGTRCDGSDDVDNDDADDEDDDDSESDDDSKFVATAWLVLIPINFYYYHCWSCYVSVSSHGSYYYCAVEKVTRGSIN